MNANGVRMWFISLREGSLINEKQKILINTSCSLDESDHEDYPWWLVTVNGTGG